MTPKLCSFQAELHVGLHTDVFVDGIGPWAGTVAALVDNDDGTATITFDLDPIPVRRPDVEIPQEPIPVQRDDESWVMVDRPPLVEHGGFDYHAAAAPIELVVQTGPRPDAGAQLAHNVIGLAGDE